MTADIVFDKDQRIGVVTLCRPKALNALTLDMVKVFYNQLKQWQDDDDIQAVLVQAEPGKAFCAGGDVRWLYEAGLAKNPLQTQFFWHEYRLNHLIHQYKKPYLALMDGITMGGGVGISLHGSNPVASERFLFSMPETGLGLFPDIGASYLLARCPGRLGVYLGLTGNRLTAQDALLAGLVKHVIASEKFPYILPGLHELDLSQDANQQVDRFLQTLSSQEAAPLAADLERINHYFLPNQLTDIIRELESSDDSWAASTLANLQQKSPISLFVTLEQIERAKSLSMGDCVKMDYCLVNHFMADHDFYEGVRALLIDKDKNPKWQPNTIASVSSAQVAKYFECEQQELSFN
jgi:enoyl-CoA hydratase/carnithine racemase